MGHRVVDDGEEGNGEKPELEGDASNIFLPEVLEAVGEVSGEGMREEGRTFGKGIAEFGCIAQRTGYC